MRKVNKFSGGIPLLIWLLTLLAAFATSCASANQGPDIVQMIGDAKTAADHEAIAEYYDRQTTEAEGYAKVHEAMAAQYQRFHPRWDLESHCIEMAKYFEGIAQQDSQLAAAHRAMAQQAR